MTITSNRFRAPWGLSLKIVTTLVMIWGIGLTVVLVTTFPRGGFPYALWLAIVLAPMFVSAGAAPFMVLGYELDGTWLRVRRPFWSDSFALDDLQRAWSAPDSLAKSWRLAGNGGLFVISGLFTSKRLGRYRAFATDPKRAVVLEFEGRKVVITPDSPEAFLRAMGELRPHVPQTVNA